MRVFSRRPVFAAALASLCIAAGASKAPAKSLTFEDFISLGRVSDPQISPDGRHVAFVVNYQSMKENSGNSDIYLVPMRGGAARRLTQSPKSDTHPRFSPDGKWIAFTSSRSGKSQVWVLPTRGGEARQVTDLSTGASNPEWTPDGSYIIFTSSVYPDCPDDDCNKKRDEDLESSKVKARIYDHLLYRHWDHWRDEKKRHVFKVSSDGEDVKDLTPGDVAYPTFTLGSSHDIAISPDSGELCITANPGDNLERNINNDLFVLNLEDGAMKKITQSEANDNHPVYSPDGLYVAYRAMKRPNFEADQYRLLLHERRSGDVIDVGADLADRLDRSVGSITWAPDSRSIYVTCSDAGYNSLYRIDIRSKKAKQLTRKMYVASPRISRSGKTMVFLRQSSSVPYEVYRADRNATKFDRLSHVNDEILASIEMNPLEEFTFTGAEDARVQGFILKPPGFDAGRKYPLVFLIHGGPQGAWRDGVSYRWSFQMFAAQGYVVVAVNPRGSTGFGQKFTDEISTDWGNKVYTDLMNGLDFVLENYSFIDKERIAAAGASFGGYMIAWIAGHTDRFTCLIDHDGVYNLTSFYGTTEELWFPEWDFGGVPWEDREKYREYSPHNYAQNFKTPMLVIHGGKDYRVDLSEGLQLFTALQRKGVPSKLLYFPDEGHWVLKPHNAELWWRTVHEWLAEWLE
ncbi:MAG: S9 family peptidase [Candidatus Krumholzibacteria bacterium]